MRQVLNRELAALMAALVAPKTHPPGDPIPQHSERAGREIRFSNFLGENSPEALELFFSIQVGGGKAERIKAVAKKRLLLRMMSLSGNRDFLAAAYHTLDTGAPELTLRALFTLVQLDSPASSARMRPFLRHAEPAYIMLSLRYFRSRAGMLNVKELRPLLKHPRPDVQRHLLEVLAFHPEPIFQRHCRASLEHAAETVRLAAVRCLAQSGGPAAMAALIATFARHTEWVQVQIVRAVARNMGGAAFPHLIAWLRSPRPRVAIAALLALQELNNRRTVPTLIEAITGRGTVIPRRVLIKSLGLYRQQRGVAYLGKLLAPGREEPDRIFAIEAIGDAGLIEGQTYLLPYLSSHDQPLRAAAVKAIQAIAAQNASAGKR